MARTGKLLAFSNPVSAEREAEYNVWYDGVHAAEIMALPGIAGMKRYRHAAQVSHPGTEPRHRYVAIYELDDVDAALKGFAEAAASLAISDAMDFTDAQVMCFEEIFSRD